MVRSEERRLTSSEPWITFTRDREAMNLRSSLALCSESRDATWRLDEREEARVSTRRETNSGSSTFKRPTNRA